MNKVRFGIISTADIGIKKVIPALQASSLCEVMAIASRDLQAAQKAASLLHIPKHYGSYADLLNDPEIDAVYISLPNHLHVPWSVKALHAGKHVLCEKPIAMSAAEAIQLLQVCAQYPHLKVMEAFMYRFHPQWKIVKDILKEGSLGDIKTIHSVFSFFNADPANIRNIKSMGGGSLMDIGCYCISLSRWLFEKEPGRVAGTIDTDPVFDIDRTVNAMLDFGVTTASFTCSTQMFPSQKAHIMCSKGGIEVEVPFVPSAGQQARIRVHRENRTQFFEPEAKDQYTLQADAFAGAILDNTEVPLPLTDSINNMKVIEAVLRAGQISQWVTV